MDAVAPQRGLILPSTLRAARRGPVISPSKAIGSYRALLRHALVAGRVLEPCAGRGHLVVELRRHGLDVVARDLYAHRDPLIDDIETPLRPGRARVAREFDWLVTNPPFTSLDWRIARCSKLCARDRVGLASLARLEWIAPARRAPLVHQNERLAGIVMLTRRPRWIEGPGASHQDIISSGLSGARSRARLAFALGSNSRGRQEKLQGELSFRERP